MEFRGVADRAVNDDALVLSAIHKRFGAVQALAGASITVRRGTLHAVLGENGAGKTTLMRIAFGLLRADAGTMAIAGKEARFASSADAIRHGIGMVHQHFTLVPAMTTAENIALGGRGILNIRAVARRIRTLAQQTGLAVDPDARVASLGVGAQQRVEILKALYGNARTIILDEPSAVLTPQESTELFAWLRLFVGEGGTAVLVTHKLNEALLVADYVTVLRRGYCVLTASAVGLDSSTVVRAVTGDEGPVPLARPCRRTGPHNVSVARLSGVSVTDHRGVRRVREARFEGYAGEIIGLAGVEGSGVHEVIRLLAGRMLPNAGVVSLPQSIGFIPEDRLRDAIIGEFTLTENFALRGAAARTGRLRWGDLAGQTATVMQHHGVQALAPTARAGALSGGNQQKFVVGREIEDRPALVVAENPVRGLDIRATEHVFSELEACAAAGSCVVIYSADVDELLPLVDRMFVVFGGTLREVPVERGAVVSALVGAL